MDDNLNALDIGQTEITFGRKANPAQYENAEAIIKMVVTPSPGSGGDEITQALRALAVAVEGELAQVKQRADLYRRLYARLLKLNVTADDAASALDVLGIKAWPVELSDLLAACQKVEGIRDVSQLPKEWVWWRTGKGPHPSLGLPNVDIESNHPPLDVEMAQAAVATKMSSKTEGDPE